MRKITQAEFDEAHDSWLRNLGVRLDFSERDLTEIKFSERADLHGVDLHGANLGWAVLTGAALHGADLQDACLCWADLRGADLQGANLRDANLRVANLRDADLQGADLRGANLCDTDLRGADLDYACWPLWCGSQAVKIDEKQLYQLIAHVCAVTVDDSADFATIKDFLLSYAEKSHIYEYLKDSINKEEDK